MGVLPHHPVRPDRQTRAAAGRERRGGYQLTDCGRHFYREHYAAHTAAHPHIDAPHPDGAAAEPWPPRADEILDRYRALCSAWHTAEAARSPAEAEAAAGMVEPDRSLPAEVAGYAAARHELWCATARQRADLAAEQTARLHAHAERAAHAYAVVAALTAYSAAVTATCPLTGLAEPGDTDDDWDEQRLMPPPETGIHAIDSEVGALYGAVIGKPRRRGPAPKPRTRESSAPIPRPPDPAHNLAALARCLHGHIDGGKLLRLLHPAHVSTGNR